MNSKLGKQGVGQYRGGGVGGRKHPCVGWEVPQCKLEGTYLKSGKMSLSHRCDYSLLDIISLLIKIGISV